MDDLCSTQMMDFDDEPDSLSVNDSTHKFQAAILKVLPYEDFPETTHPVYSGINTVGRGTECSVQILIPSLCKEHAIIEIIDDCHLISDLGSTNKTKRGKLVLKPNIKYELKFDDIITLGDVVCQYIQSTELVGDGTVESELEINGLGSEFVLRYDSDSESNGGFGETSFPVVSETSFNPLNALKINSNSSTMSTCANVETKQEFQSDSETNIEEVKEKKYLEQAETLSLNNDKAESSKVGEIKVKTEDSTADEFYNMTTQKFSGDIKEIDVSAERSCTNEEKSVDISKKNAKTRKRRMRMIKKKKERQRLESLKNSTQNTAYISNLDSKTNSEGLKSIFLEKLQDCKSVYIFTDSDGKSQGCGLVEFQNSEDLEKALKLNVVINGKTILIEKDDVLARDETGRKLILDGNKDKKIPTPIANKMVIGKNKKSAKHPTSLNQFSRMKKHFGPTQRFAFTERHFSTTQHNFVAPQHTFTTFRQSQHNFGAPQHNFGAPQHNFGASQHNFISPQQNFIEPQHNFIAPQHNFGLTQPNFAPNRYTFDQSQREFPRFSNMYDVPQAINSPYGTCNCPNCPTGGACRAGNNRVDGRVEILRDVIQYLFK